MFTQSIRPEYLTIAQVAGHFGVHTLTVRRWISAGRLPAQRLGARSIRIRTDDVEKFARDREIA
ncbi:helix-turn-helix domain-containing protein [Mycolicibacterium elephantis]